MLPGKVEDKVDGGKVARSNSHQLTVFTFSRKQQCWWEDVLIGSYRSLLAKEVTNFEKKWGTNEIKTVHTYHKGAPMFMEILQFKKFVWFNPLTIMNSLIR